MALAFLLCGLVVAVASPSHGPFQTAGPSKDCASTDASGRCVFDAVDGKHSHHEDSQAVTEEVRGPDAGVERRDTAAKSEWALQATVDERLSSMTLASHASALNTSSQNSLTATAKHTCMSWCTAARDLMESTQLCLYKSCDGCSVCSKEYAKTRVRKRRNRLLKAFVRRRALKPAS